MSNISTASKQTDAEQLKADYQLLQQQSGIRARDAASTLKVAEGQLLAAHVGTSATRLVDDAQAILSAIEPLSEVMALTRNHACVHERKGIYTNPRFSTMGSMKVGLFANPDIDLRLFMDHWKYCFAATHQAHGLTRNSLQFFDKEGVAIHKIYLTNNSNHEAYNQLIATHRHPHQDKYIDCVAYSPTPASTPDDAVNWVAFRTAWEGLQDTHAFHPLLRRFKVSRQQAFSHIGSDFAYEVDTNATQKVLQLASTRNCEIMVFVGNRGCIQIHTGLVQRLAERDGWYNVLDPQFNLHLFESTISRSWVTKKPTADGLVTALEVFDAEGDSIVTFFGKRKPGTAELSLWREIIDSIPITAGANHAF